MHSIKSGVGAAGIIVSFVVAAGFAAAAPAHRGGGGGAPHPAPAMRAAAPRAAPHFAAPRAAPRAAPHFAAPRAAPHSAARPSARISAHRGAPNLPARHGAALPPNARAGANAMAHPRGSNMRPSNLQPTNARLQPTNARRALTHDAGRADPRHFAARRRLAGDPVFRPFAGRGWHRNHHLGWVGPVFWPYAFGDFFYSALWPDDYDNYDPVWAYGYDDIFTGIFSPYDYEPYVQGPQAPARMASLTQGMKDACEAEAAEVTNWPIDQIQQVIQPNDQQKALLDDLGNAIVTASSGVTAHCPASVAFTPVDRLAQMGVRLQGLIDAVNTISPPLTKFYDSLDDEQKARFNAMKPVQDATASNTAPDAAMPDTANSQAENPEPANPDAASPDTAKRPNDPQEACGSANVMAWPTEKIDQVLQPSDAQKQKLQALQSAAAQAADAIRAACPSEPPATPPGRLAAVGKRLEAQLAAVQAMEAPLKDFYDSLNDEQKARFNNMGQQISAQK